MQAREEGKNENNMRNIGQQLFIRDEQFESLDEILETLRRDLAERGSPVPDGTQPFDLAMRLLKEYTPYPLPPDAAIPYNYCALGGLVPALKPLLRLVCVGV